jgi:hypothetical protein
MDLLWNLALFCPSLLGVWPSPSITATISCDLSIPCIGVKWAVLFVARAGDGAPE